MKILLTGKNGQLGFELQRALAPLGDVVAVGTAECNLADEEALRRLIQTVRPDIIVNPAAYTAVDRAESDQETAFAVNAKAPGVIGEEAAKLGASVIHFSTDYVFDGEKSGHYSESDATNPQSTYGRSKLQGEKALCEATSQALVLRTSWVVGAHGNNFAKTMLRLASEREELKVVADQFGAPTSAALLADVTSHLVRRMGSEKLNSFPFGVYHLAAGGETSWHAYAQFVIGEAQKAGKTLKATPDRVLPIPAASYPAPAKRPQNSRLDTQRFQTAFSLVLPDWRQGVGHILQTIL
jgi:dTDP-4-dehydrorhamnose reductase